ncbi:MAG: protoporphyrinogen oxidase HemJ [Alphaproteobacteria bacterium]|nr:protoporphyrinogen oxidase HemJ [Alphaproteobacteria bacterium]
MMQFLADYYRWLLAFHIISVMFWMAGMYYLPRLFVYHVEALENKTPSEMFPVMEEKLLRIIMTPAMAAAWIFGLSLIFAGGHWPLVDIWLISKLAVVVALSAYHGFLSATRKRLLDGTPPRPSRFYRMINEVPPVLTVVIVILVVVQPF